ncbi:MAG TPA: ATP-binding protein [Ktedonobacteraceae bacterium]|nr:ATP-binding protein [Ktedonobacteraceae bacterium]
MSWPQKQHSGDWYDRMTVLVGSAIRLLCGEAGVFVVANEAFDPQSSPEHVYYRVPEPVLPLLLAAASEGVQPSSAHPLVINPAPLSGLLALQLGLYDADTSDAPGNNGAGEAGATEDAGDGARIEVLSQRFELCSLFVHDPVGMLGYLHYVRPAGVGSCFERHDADQGALRLFIAQLAAGLRGALKAQALVKEQGRLAAIFEYSADGILTVDNALRIIDFNPAMERLTGWREDEVLGRFYYEVLRAKDMQGNEIGLQDSPLLQALAGNSVANREMYISARDGQLFPVRVTASWVRSSWGEPMNGILNVRDITREREEEEQRSTFISVVSHELQTPIAIIKGYASTLARPDATFEPASIRTRLEAIEEEADRLNKLVGNLLYASRIEAGGLQMEIVPLDLANLIEGVVRRLQAKAPDVSINLDIPDNLPTVMADRDRIEEVLQNLLDNAIKYSPHERVIQVTCRATGEEVVVSVADRGMGISLRDQEQIFQRFRRGRDSSTYSLPGAGLGLYISKAIIEAHGGHIWVESTLHEGSKFSFSLPRVEKAQLPMVVF